ncbi:MAG: WYL domain-containing protein [Spirochaetaceae bacterium]|jgi:predicted DNA-binding transcriptional regulator YafY|nr:WYL domain-containing protein [Spirochaetaceae bacterium]
MQKIRDILELIQLLDRQNGVSYKEIKEHFECSYRTAQRYIQESGVILDIKDDDREGQKRFFIQEGLVGDSLKLPDLNLSSSETMAMLLLWSRADIFQDSRFQTEIERAFHKIFHIQPEKLKQFKTLKSVILSGEHHEKNYSGKEEVLDDLIQAMAEHRCCQVIYHSFWKDEMASFTINPLHLFQRDGGLYFFTTIKDYKDIRALAVERIHRLELMDKTFQAPAEFDPQDYLETTFNLTFGEPMDFLIRFSSTQARYIRQKRWAKEQEYIPQKDGSVLLKMRTSGFYDVKRWVMSYGAEAEVLEPIELREDIKNELLRASGNY